MKSLPDPGRTGAFSRCAGPVALRQRARRGDRSRRVLRDALLLALSVLPLRGWSLSIPPAQAEEIGRRLWQNECGGSVLGLTSWNAGEAFASLGIGHFIWYPAGSPGSFEESFPPLLRFLTARGVILPEWLLQANGCPWPDRPAFTAAQHGARMQELRRLLAETVSAQAEFAANRLELALPKILEAAPPEDRERVRRNFFLVAAQPAGVYALVDYVNFKGEGVRPSERYRGEGWGLRQVLQIMRGEPPLRAFREAADQVLTRRVENSPPTRHEAQWLPGWRNRVRTYAE